jgi:hypothetical protein
MRTSLLLFLQLLLVALAILALVRPRWQGTSLEASRMILLVDNSASMSATDVAPSRLAEAKKRVEELIDQMPSGGQAMIISFSDGAQVVQEFTDNRQLLRQRLRTIRPTNHGATQIVRLRVGIRQHLDRLRAVVGADPGGDTEAPVGVDGNRERRLLRIGVPLGHQRKFELVGALGRQRDADQSPPVDRHEVDVIGRDHGRGHHEVAFVLTILVVGDDDHLALADVFEGVFDAVELHVWQYLCEPHSGPSCFL